MTRGKLARTETALQVMGKARELLEDISRSEPDEPDVFKRERAGDDGRLPGVDRRWHLDTHGGAGDRYCPLQR